MVFESAFSESNPREARRHRRLLAQHARRLRTDHRHRRRDGYDNSDSHDTRRTKHMTPEETYEVWHQEREINSNILKYGGAVVDHDVNGREGKEEEEEAEEEEEEEDDDEDSYINPQLALRFLVEQQGLEVLPMTTHAPQDQQTAFLSHTATYARTHTNVVVKLLHLNVLKRQWKLAYKCFSILIRLPVVDIRNIWPLGLETITRLAELRYSEQHGDGVSEYSLRTYGDGQLSLFKDEQFLNWLETFYPPTSYLNPNRWIKPLAYRGGSIESAPYFVSTLIWTLLMKGKFSAVNEKLEELLVKRPYVSDGVYHFLQGLSFQLEAASLCREIDMDKQLAEKLLLDAQGMYTKARQLGADFPEKLIKNELNLIKSRLADDLDGDHHDVDDRKWDMGYEID